MSMEEKVRIPLPKAKQLDNYDCGPAVLSSICNYYKVGPKNYNQYIEDCKTTKKYGTEPKNLILAAKKYKLKVKEINCMSINQLQEFLNNEIPVILYIQAWGEKIDYQKLKSGHYVIAIGYDEKIIYCEDPYIDTKKRGFISKKQLLNRWKGIDNGKILNQYGIVIWKNYNKKIKNKEYLNLIKKIN